jgi:virginiamycin B lyase
MQRRERLVALAIVLTASACERTAMPTATVDGSDPLFAAGPAGHFKSFRIPTASSDPRHITLGSDGNMWFTESNINVNQIGRIDAGGNITEFAIPPEFGQGSQPDDIVSGPDGALWFTAPSGFPNIFIGRVTTDGQFTGFAPECDPLGGCSIRPNGITSGPDGNLWFTEGIRNAVVRLTPSGTFTFFTIPTVGAEPTGITVGPDGALWFSELQGNKIGRITTSGQFTEFGPATSPDRITLGPDGNLWFTEAFSDAIGRITPAGEITEFPIPEFSQSRDIVAGPDGNLWFTRFNGEQLSQITPQGVVTDVQRVRGGPWGIGRGQDGAIWLTVFTGNKVGRFTLR